MFNLEHEVERLRLHIYKMCFLIDLASNNLKTFRTHPEDAMDFFEIFDNNMKMVYEFVCITNEFIARYLVWRLQPYKS